MPHKNANISKKNEKQLYRRKIVKKWRRKQLRILSPIQKDSLPTNIQGGLGIGVDML